MPTSEILYSHDLCDRREFLARRWRRHTLHPTQILRQSVQFGLESVDASAQSAADHALLLAVDRGIETDDPNLLGIAEHVSSLAEIVVWTVQGGGWDHPEDVKVGDHLWESSAFLSVNQTRLRQIWLVDRWDEAQKTIAMHSWAIGGEMAIYGIPMDLLVAIVGPRREERWHSAWTKGFLHPVSNDLRFRRRDGEEFGSTWGKVWREQFKGSKEDWLGSATDDGLLPEMLIVEELYPEHIPHWRDLAARQLDRIASTRTIPDPHLSQCDLPMSPCPFRNCCPNFILPSNESGFTLLP